MDVSGGAAAGGLRPALARLGSSLVGTLRTRAELAGVEIVEERERLVLRLALLVGGMVAFALAALFIGVFVVVWSWETRRLLAIALVALVYALAGGVLIARARAIVRAAPAPFAATLSELEKDRVRLKRACTRRRRRRAMTRMADLEAKKQLLIAQAEFDRLQLAIAVHDVRRLVRPSFDGPARPGPPSTASRLIGFMGPLLGTSRLGGVVRALSIALSAYRLMRQWSRR